MTWVSFGHNFKLLSEETMLPLQKCCGSLARFLIFLMQFVSKSSYFSSTVLHFLTSIFYTNQIRTDLSTSYF